MPLSPNEIRDRALAFAREWEGEKRERAEAQTFWNEFFHVFGVSRRRLASFEEPVKRARRRAGTDLFGAAEAHGGGFIDLFWKGVLIAEHKSRGKDLDTAYEQALDYFEGIKERDLPHYVIVSDFARIRLYDLEAGTQDDIALGDLYKRIDLFGFIAGYTPQRIEEQDPVNVRAAERMGRLYDQLRASGYPDHALKVLLVRLLFCLFAEDTTLFEPKGAFQTYIEENTREDGGDLGGLLNYIFQILNTPEATRQKSLDERLASLPWVNGKLFEETLPIAAFTGTMRQTLLDCCALDWARISPAIFGALFQSVMDKDARRHLGAHYTSERNILKLIKPLFLDDLRAEFEKSKRSRNRLFELHKKIAALRFLDPACGCGNFLVIAYRELRELELDILKAERASEKQQVDVQQLLAVNVDQFYGIELEEFPAQIAQVALWLTDHQMNLKASQSFGFYYRRLPLTHSATIRQGNALALDWNEVIPAEEVSYILGNPPFVGAKYMDEDQRSDMARVWHGVNSCGLLDYVTAWYCKAAQYLRGDGEVQRFLDQLSDEAAPKDRVKVAFVSTNSISQGEQVGVLWGELLRLGAKIHFAHRTFQWSSEAPGKAAVHCVIVGWALFDTSAKRLFEYADIRGEPQESAPANINPYLVDAPDVLIARRGMPICAVPEIRFGNQPIDGGNFLLDELEKVELLRREPGAANYIHRFIGSEELINNVPRYCLWLNDVDPAELKRMAAVKERVTAVRDFREQSKREATRKLADTPTRFAFVSQPDSPFLAIPSVSSERRQYIPMALFEPSV
ncbi:MAG TPA: DNA methyltransferase, partial [Gammaproteobacteria bacterium]|nr:DNA methyltransferase [Gammaproteobacteria bacterium]